MSEENNFAILSFVFALAIIVGAGVPILKDAGINLNTAGLLNSFGDMLNFKKDAKNLSASAGDKTGIKPILFGRITAIDGNSVTIQGSIAETYTVDISNIKVTDGQGASAKELSMSDIKSGDTVQVLGKTPDVSISPSSIIDMGNPLEHFIFNGVISNAQKNSFVIQRPGATKGVQPLSYMVQITDSTVFKKSGIEVSSSDINITNGQTATVTGVVDQIKQTITAKTIDISAGKTNK